jgi:hypothetical protein
MWAQQVASMAEIDANSPPSDRIYTSSLIASQAMKVAPRDNWGNVRVPRLEWLDHSSKIEPGAWLPVPAATLPEQYSSLLGIPVVGLREGPTVDFSLETSYMSLSCGAWHHLGTSSGSLLTYFGQIWRPVANYTNLSNSLIPFGFRRSNRSFSPRPTFFFDTDLPFNRSSKTSPKETRRVHFGFLAPWGLASVSVTSCSVRETHVEAAVTCPSGLDCRVMKMRHSQADKRSNGITPLDNSDVATLVFKYLPEASPTTLQPHMTITDLFLNDSTRVAMPRLFRDATVNMTRLSPATFSARLTLVLNTYYQSFLPSYAGAYVGDLPANLSKDGHDWARGAAPRRADTNLFLHASDVCPYMCWRSARAVMSASKEEYRGNVAWIAILLACSAALLATGLAGAVLGWRACVPDMLGYASSMTYENPHFAVPDHGGVLDAMDRARLLQDVRVRIGDVKGAGDVGRIAFTNPSNTRRLEKGRMYT